MRIGLARCLVSGVGGAVRDLEAMVPTFPFPV